MTTFNILTALGIAIAVFLILFVGCALTVSSDLDDQDERREPHL